MRLLVLGITNYAGGVDSEVNTARLVCFGPTFDRGYGWYGPGSARFDDPRWDLDLRPSAVCT